ncbi:uncharacterized protein LOC128241845 [Mya arenaria]|uniref:uncharacterized protein LOC128241845 n=1 Tax=Mya arenaria TaxID=6604 RepID=UPI0022E00B0D|nr:uncharacterized protein LOC128241845 [Mya arenaria]
MENGNGTISFCLFKASFWNCDFSSGYFYGCLTGIFSVPLLGFPIRMLLPKIKRLRRIWCAKKENAQKHEHTKANTSPFIVPDEKPNNVDEQGETSEWPFTLSNENKTNLQNRVRNEKIYVAQCEGEKDVLRSFKTKINENLEDKADTASSIIILHQFDQTRTKNSLGICVKHIDEDQQLKSNKEKIIVIFYNTGQTCTETYQGVEFWYAL